MKQTNTTNDRAAEIRAALKSAEADLAAARERLGVAIADGDKSAAAEAREDAETAERLASELRSALPVAERRAREQAQAEAQRQRRASEKAANEARARRIAQARKVDKAMEALGREFDRLLALDTGGTGANAAHVIRRQRYSARGAFALHAQNLARVLDVPVIPSAHRRAMADAEAGLISEFPEAESA